MANYDANSRRFCNLFQSAISSAHFLPSVRFLVTRPELCVAVSVLIKAENYAVLQFPQKRRHEIACDVAHHANLTLLGYVMFAFKSRKKLLHRFTLCSK